MFRLLHLLLLFLFITNYTATAQCTFNATDYSVTLDIAPVSLTNIVDQCATNGGFTYQVELEYTITFTGNPPSQLWNFQGSISCSNSNQTSTFNLPREGVNSTGTVIAANASASQSLCPATEASPASLGCETISINISGPNGLSGNNQDCTPSTTPVTLISYNVTSVDQGILLSWDIAEKYNHDHYEILHSNDALSWESVTKLYDQSYSLEYLHKNPSVRNNYYRVVQRDIDGSSSVLFQDFVALDTYEKSSYRVFPNPIHSDDLNIEILNEQLSDKTTVFLYNTRGSLVAKDQLSNAKRFNSINIDGLSDGLYYLQVGNSQEISKIIINR